MCDLSPSILSMRSKKAYSESAYRSARLLALCKCPQIADVVALLTDTEFRAGSLATAHQVSLTGRGPNRARRKFGCVTDQMRVFSRTGSLFTPAGLITQAWSGMGWYRSDPLRLFIFVFWTQFFLLISLVLVSGLSVCAWATGYACSWLSSVAAWRRLSASATTRSAPPLPFLFSKQRAPICIYEIMAFRPRAAHRPGQETSLGCPQTTGKGSTCAGSDNWRLPSLL